jgi:peptide/nickel transport system substrate-binding protein
MAATTAVNTAFIFLFLNIRLVFPCSVVVGSLCTKKVKTTKQRTMTGQFLPHPVAKATQLARAAALFSALFMASPALAERPIRMGLADAPLTLDATRATDATSQRVIGLFSFGLIKLAEDFTPLPAAAVLKNQSPTSFTFQLRSLYFTDGTPLTPAWVKAYYDNLRAEGSTSPFKASLARIASITLGDHNTLTFTLNNPDPNPWSLFTLPLTRQKGDSSIGLGPYRVTDHSASRTVLEPVSKGLSPLVLDVVKDPTVRLLKLLNHEIDLLQDDIPLELFNKARHDGLKAITGTSASYTYLGFNHQSPALQDVRVRQAIAQAINLPDIRNNLLFGLAKPADSLLLPSHPAHWAAPDWAYNPAAARQLLAEAGYGPQKPLELTLTLSTNPLVYRVGQVFQQDLAKVGVKLTLQTLEWASFYTAVQNGRAEMYIMNWVGQFGVDSYRQLFHSQQTPPNGLNRGRVNHPEMDRLTDALQQEFSPAKQRRLASDIQKIQHDNLLYLPLWRLDRFALMAPGVSGYSLDPLGGFTGLFHVAHEEPGQPKPHP